MIKLGLILCLTTLFAASGCAKPRIMIDRVLVQNGTDHTITNVQVLHEPTRKFGGVSAILPQESLEVGISKRPMLAESAMISWTDAKGQQREQAVQLPYDSTLAKKEEPMNLVYVIQESGRVTTYLQTSTR